MPEEKTFQEMQDELEMLRKKNNELETEISDLKNSRFYKLYILKIYPVIHIIKKILKNGPRWTIQKTTQVAQKYIFRMKRPIEKYMVLPLLKKDIADKTVIVLPPVIDYDMPLFQRPQQLATSYAKKENTTVLYLTNNVTNDRCAYAKSAGERLWIISAPCFDGIFPLLEKAKKTIVSFSWAANKPYVDKYKFDKFIYEYIDALEVSCESPDEGFLADHNMLLQKADLTVCTADYLFEQVKGRTKKCIYSPNGCDFELFSQTSNIEINPILKESISNYQCVLGYYGALAKWFDYDLIEKVARKNPDWLIVLVGLNYDGSMEKSNIKNYPNILYIPQQPYQSLPSFLKGFDVAIIPFIINEITRSTSPVKMFEYMAGGKPVLTSRMPECLKYESVRTYADADEFCKITEEYMAMKPEDPYWKTLKREALENTWDARTDEILKAVEEI